MRLPLPANPFDVVVIGGGVHGTMIARHCALAGKRTLLLDQNDFGSGMTSRATRVVGDAFPDLERGDFSLARESLRERDRLLMERGHLVRSIPGLIALGPERRRSALEVRFGMWLRRRLAGSPKTATVAEVRSLKGMLQPEKQWSIFSFDDAVCEFPERLVSEWMCEATAAGAVVRNYCRVLHVDCGEGEVRGVVVRDVLDQTEGFIKAGFVVNATGCSLEQLGAQSEVRNKRGIVPVRSSHVVLRKFPAAPNATVYVEGIDGRALTLHPWNGQLLFGATQVVESNTAASSQPSDAEIEYLQRSLARCLADRDVEITGAFAGISCGYVERGAGADVIRNRALVVDHSEYGARGLISIFAGPLVTAGTAARECARKMGFSIPEADRGKFLAGRENGIETALKHWARTVAVFARIPESTARALAEWHGRRALCIARLALSDKRLRAPLCEGSNHIVAEAVDAARFQCAVRLSDVLLRRVPVALADGWSAHSTATAAERIGEVLGWSEAETQSQIETVETERALILRAAPRTELGRMPQIPDSLAA